MSKLREYELQKENPVIWNIEKTYRLCSIEENLPVDFGNHPRDEVRVEIYFHNFYI
jgi:hypothetical protein